MSRRWVTVLALLGAVALAIGGILWLGQPHPDPPGSTSPSWYPMTNEAGDAVFADFENHIPCTHSFAPVAGCDRLKFGIGFYRDAAGEPTTFIMLRVYVAVSDDRTVNTGTWTITERTAEDQDTTVYR